MKTSVCFFFQLVQCIKVSQGCKKELKASYVLCLVNSWGGNVLHEGRSPYKPQLEMLPFLCNGFY